MAPTLRLITLTPDDAPASLDDPAAALLHGVARVDAAAQLASRGHGDAADPVAQRLGQLRHADYVRTSAVVAVLAPDDVVGYAWLRAMQTSNTDAVELEVCVHPDHRRRGVGAALWDAAVAVVRDQGRHVVQAYSDVVTEPPPGPGALVPPTGSGRVPADDDATRFALARGFALEQLERMSRLDLPVDPGLLRRFAEAAGEHADDQYLTQTWFHDVPESALADIAALESRMMTDAPSGGLELEADPWDAARLRTWLDRFTERGQSVLLTAAVHVPTGRIVGYTALIVPTEPDDARPVADQDTTIVDPEHRGHRLGMAVKVANLEALAARRPDVRRVVTWNAEENGPMLDINVALGFRPDGGFAAWQLRLPD
ncbi:GNAT family N-acetyltransferase [Luteimicrobium sp. DT211]|uniref:GNAT family N-acetyltransferase n=1 Tax=Luteimicrobium sp. DT211 TaxID=3393412 RepID=UPI003CEDA1AE